MEQPFSSSKVTVEYFDPHNVFKLLAPGLVPRLPLRNLHWQSHAGPLRSIDTLHVELVRSGDTDPLPTSPITSPTTHRSDSDGFQTQIGAHVPAAQSNETIDSVANRNSIPARRHQIPGLRRTPYLKVLLVRCDDNDSYKSHVRQEIRDWIKAHTPPPAAKKTNTAENHDAFEWLIVHLVIPNTVAATQPRKSDSTSAAEKPSTTSRWRPGSSTLLEKLRSDFNSSGKASADHVAQIRIGVNDVPYDSLPRVVPAVPTGYSETEQETENAWTDLISKFRGLILTSFDLRVTQYEEDIKEKDAQRTLPGWNFCTFFILKEGLARGFESVGLVEDALVGYDELSVGLDMVVKERSLGSSGSAANALLTYTEDLKQAALQAKAAVSGADYGEAEDELVDLQSTQNGSSHAGESYDDITISSSKKPYRDLIVANNVSVFDFRCYIFARQISLLLRLGNAWSTREELLAKLKEQQESVLYGVAPRAPPPKHKENEQEELPMLAEICRRTLEFIPAASQVMRQDLMSALAEVSSSGEEKNADISFPLDPAASEVIDNMVASFAFCVAQQILAQTSTKALPIPPSSLGTPDGHEPKTAIPEPKTMMHPARSSSLNVRQGIASGSNPAPSPNAFSGRPQAGYNQQNLFLKAGLEDLAARRAELYTLSRNILKEAGKKRAWSDGWDEVPIVGESTTINMVDIDLGDDSSPPTASHAADKSLSMFGIDSKLLKTALDNTDDFYRLYEILTDKSLRHYTVANHTHSIQTSMADLAVLKYHLGDYVSAASYFWRTTPFFGESGWSLLELSMLIMYSRCLKKLERKDEYFKVILKLLSKAAAAENDRQQVRTLAVAHTPENEAIRGVLSDLIQETTALSHEMRVPLSNFFSYIEPDGLAEYGDGQDSLSIHLKLNSVLVDDLELDIARVRIINTTFKPPREMWLTHDGPICIKPGRSKLQLTTNSIIPGSYEINEIDFIIGKLRLHFERDFGDRTATLLKSPSVSIFHPADNLDVRLSLSKHVQLDRNNTVDMELDPGWNNLDEVEIRVKAATGGLRLLTSEAKCLHPTFEIGLPRESGLFVFRSVPPRTTIGIRFPYSLEQETPSVSIRIEVMYKTKYGNYTFSKTPTVHNALAVGVNVQDIFKHEVLLSKFTVSTASSSPLRLFKSELISSDAFESSFGVAPSRHVVIFPRQPASLLYKIRRKGGSQQSSNLQKTIYLKLQYSVLRDEIENLVGNLLEAALENSPLCPLARLLKSSALLLVRDLPGPELERAALLGLLDTSFLVHLDCRKIFMGLSQDAPGMDVSESMAAFLEKWRLQNPVITLPDFEPEEPSSILIPVDIPSVTIVHTADIRLQPSLTAVPSPGNTDLATPTFCTHQLLPATLHLKWTRIWATAVHTSKQTDLEFSYELAAPQDTWLLGGRRKGHFVIPAPVSSDAEYTSSTIDTEAEIPILLIPLREGWLPYPNVEIREVKSAGSSSAGINRRSDEQSQFETDFRNIGETVRIIADRTRVTLSLDASGPGGGPLVLDMEKQDVEGRVLVA
ncbi:cis-golgi transport protein particle complex subunit [Xylariaceae sp. FL0255]|nr:cis-golgi transport protein particle complex subunit [Xylariaceae sp. FL0255]